MLEGSWEAAAGIADPDPIILRVASKRVEAGKEVKVQASLGPRRRVLLHQGPREEKGVLSW